MKMQGKNVGGYHVPFPVVLEQLRSVIDSYPLPPGDTISHSAARACCQLGYIVRDADGNWIPTRSGIEFSTAMERDGQ